MQRQPAFEVDGTLHGKGEGEGCFCLFCCADHLGNGRTLHDFAHPQAGPSERMQSARVEEGKGETETATHLSVVDVKKMESTP